MLFGNVSTDDTVEPSGCIVYARVSSNGQKSLADQLQAGADYASRRNLPVHKSITDVGSGRNVADAKKLPGYGVLCAEAIKRPGTILVVYDISRLGRCLEVFGVIDVLLKAGVQIYSVFEDLLVTSADSGSILRAHKLVVNAIEYSNQLSRRVKDAYAMKKRRKVFTGTKAPYGFMITVVAGERRLAINPATHKFARRLALTKRNTVKRPEGMSLWQLQRLRAKFRTYNALVYKPPKN